jgi:hypothetical protein
MLAGTRHMQTSVGRNCQKLKIPGSNGTLPSGFAHLPNPTWKPYVPSACHDSRHMSECVSSLTEYESWDVGHQVTSRSGVACCESSSAWKHPLADVQVLELAGGLHQPVERQERGVLLRRDVLCSSETRSARDTISTTAPFCRCIDISASPCSQLWHRLLILSSSCTMAQLAWRPDRRSSVGDSGRQSRGRVHPFISTGDALHRLLTCQRAAQVGRRHADKVLRRAHHFLQPRVAGQLHERFRVALHHAGRPVLLLLSGLH